LTTTRDQHPNFIDVPSAIDFHLVKEFTKDHDAGFWHSHYFWWDPVVGDGKFHFGPAWDFDAKAAVDIGAETDRLRRASEPKTQPPRASYSHEIAFVKDWYAQALRLDGRSAVQLRSSSHCAHVLKGRTG
jgi:hypothetical protein